jgi:Flp pilus assembly protein TadG
MSRRGSRCHPALAERGQGMVEIALLLPVLLTLVVALVNFAFIFHTYIQVISAAGVGASYAATSAIAANDSSGISAAALMDSANWRCDQPTVTSPAPVGDPYGFQRVSVTVSCQVADLLVFPSSFGPVPVSATATRRVRQ